MLCHSLMEALQRVSADAVFPHHAGPATSPAGAVVNPELSTRVTVIDADDHRLFL
jgi:hypothetical protein